MTSHFDTAVVVLAFLGFIGLILLLGFFLLHLVFHFCGRRKGYERIGDVERAGGDH